MSLFILSVYFPSGRVCGNGVYCWRDDIDEMFMFCVSLMWRRKFISNFLWCRFLEKNVLFHSGEWSGGESYIGRVEEGVDENVMSRWEFLSDVLSIEDIITRSRKSDERFFSFTLYKRVLIERTKTTCFITLFLQSFITVIIILSFQLILVYKFFLLIFQTGAINIHLTPDLVLKERFNKRFPEI